MLAELEGKGSVLVDLPRDDDEPSTVAHHKGEPIKAAPFSETTLVDDGYATIKRYRSGKFDIVLYVDTEIGRGWVRVDKAEGYDNE